MTGTITARRGVMLEALEAAARVQRALDAPALSVHADGEVYIHEADRERPRVRLRPASLRVARAVLEAEQLGGLVPDGVLRRALLVWSTRRPGKWAAVHMLATGLGCAGETSAETLRVQISSIASARK